MPTEEIRRDPPLIGVSWRNPPRDNDLFEGAYKRAWSALCDDPRWEAWYEPVKARIRAEGEYHDMAFEPREKQRFSRRKTGIGMYVPLREAYASSDLDAFMRVTIVAFFVRYAEVYSTMPVPAVFVEP